MELVDDIQDAQERSRVACDSILFLSLNTSMNKNNAQMVELVDEVQEARVSRVQDVQKRPRVACDQNNAVGLNSRMSNLNAQVVELVDTLSWGGSGASRAGSSPALGTIYY